MEEDSGGTLRRRASFDAFATLQRELRDARLRRVESENEAVWKMFFERLDGEELLVAWSAEGAQSVRPPRAVREIVEQDGTVREADAGAETVEVGGSVRYFRL